MSHYLLQVAYAAKGWAALVQSPQNRLDAIRPAIEALGGTIESAWFCFGNYDVVLILSMPGNVEAAAFAMAAAAGGALKATKTTPLLSPEEALEAMQRAGRSGYRPPGRSS